LARRPGLDGICRAADVAAGFSRLRWLAGYGVAALEAAQPSRLRGARVLPMVATGTEI
jgi:hypothetical protein